MLLQHPDSSKEGDLLGKCSFMAWQNPAHVFRLLIRNHVCFSWLAARAEASGEAEMERTPKCLSCWPRGCSAAAWDLWNQQGCCLSSQRSGSVAGILSPSTLCRVLCGPTGISSWKDPLQQPQCALTARKYFRSQETLDFLIVQEGSMVLHFVLDTKGLIFIPLFIPRKAGLTQQHQLVWSGRCLSVPPKMLKWRQKPKLQFCV